MIAKRYGARLQSVRPNFDARAMNEIGFMRDNEWSESVEAFQADHDKAEVHELTAAAEGEVQGEAEERLLQSLEEQLLAIEQAAGGAVVIESEQGVDYPKTRHTQKTQLVEGANRLYFRFTVEPPLRVAVYRPR